MSYEAFKNREDLIQLFRKYEVLFSYLFGSQINKEATSTSDVDIAVMLPDTISENERFERRLNLISDLEKIVKKPVDLVILNDITSLFFKYIIITEGQPIYSRAEGERAEFECRIMGLYFDFSPFLETYNRAYVERNF